MTRHSKTRTFTEQMLLCLFTPENFSISVKIIDTSPIVIPAVYIWVWTNVVTIMPE